MIRVQSELSYIRYMRTTTYCSQHTVALKEAGLYYYFLLMVAVTVTRRKKRVSLPGCAHIILSEKNYNGVK